MTTFLLIIWTIIFILQMLIFKDTKNRFIKVMFGIFTVLAFINILLYAYKLFQGF
jgi:hypothetical protein